MSFLASIDYYTGDSWKPPKTVVLLIILVKVVKTPTYSKGPVSKLSEMS